MPDTALSAAAPEVDDSPVFEDWFIHMLADLENAADRQGDALKMRVTLLMGGTLVSGQVVSSREYFANLPFPSAFKDPLVAKTQALDPETAPAPAFLCLKHARFFQAGGKTAPIPVQAPPEPVYFRARISAIDGVLLGSVEAQDA